MLRKLGMAALAAATFGGGLLTASAAYSELNIPLFTYRTGPFAGAGIPIANGMHDYLSMINARDGGVGGVKINITECETGYNTQKGVECYEQVKGSEPLVINPFSTGITLQLIPRAHEDKIPLLTMGYGLSAAAEGDKFPWVFNPPSAYWMQASVILKHIGNELGGLENLDGKTLGFIYLESGYGREPIPLLEQLGERFGYDLVTYPIAIKEMQNQSSQWLKVIDDEPDYMVMWGWGAMNPSAIREAANVGYDMENFIGVWWSGGDDDVEPTGMDATGYKAANLHGTGTDYPAIQDILTHVVDPGNSQVSSRERVGRNFYNRGVVNSFFMVEAIKAAQAEFGTPDINAEQMRWGLENISITEESLEAAGLGGFMPPMEVTCEDHSATMPLFIQRWNGSGWDRHTDYIEPMTDVVGPMLEEAANKYVTDNAPWPTQDCGS